ncbi:unnamed protein product [marine sediment metagenome]|uniref:YgiT-type zinc finger domain-containing protein n=1 Tax=marine sediment metagenome TaxID=412755 RepID=X0SRD0_9ZZZZ
MCYCPQCEGATTQEPHVEKFDYVDGRLGKVKLSANVKVNTCGECGFQFLGPDAHEEMERVVQQHLNGEGS